MKTKTDVLVIGGSIAGIVTAATGKTLYPDCDFLVVRKEKEAVVPCGIPYIFETLHSTEKDLFSEAVLSDAGVQVAVDEVVSFNPRDKICRTADGTEISFARAVLATGSIPKTLPNIQGIDLENVFTVPKEKQYLSAMHARLSACHKVVIIGGGFTGVAIADELHKAGKDVTIVEGLPSVLKLCFDEDFAIAAHQMLISKGIRIFPLDGLKEILGDTHVTGVLLESGARLETDAVILAIGFQPNTAIAQEAGLPVNELGFIKTNEFMQAGSGYGSMRPEDAKILAVGDCAEKRCFITRVPRNIMLASTACAEARIAAVNLYRLSVARIFEGTIPTYTTMIGDTAFGATGITESVAKEIRFKITTATCEGYDRHPLSMENTHPQIVKLVVTRESGLIIGGQVMGGSSTGELLNLIGFAIQNRMNIYSILTAQIGTHPMLTSSPISYPLIKAAEEIARSRWVG